MGESTHPIGASDGNSRDSYSGGHPSLNEQLRGLQPSPSFSFSKERGFARNNQGPSFCSVQEDLASKKGVGHVIALLP